MQPVRTIAYGTLLVGTIDALDAIVFSAMRSGATPVRVFQGIAFGLLGRDTFRGGLASATLGLAIHYLIAFAIVTTYYVASRRVQGLTRHPVVCGAVYGICVYFFMNRVVIPLSAIGPQRFVLASFVNGIMIHVIGIGIPSSLVAAAARRQSPLPAAPSRT